MATRIKTVQFTTPTRTTTITNATVTNLDQITLYIPETVISFRSVFVDVFFQDIITVTGGTVGDYSVGLQLGSSGYTTISDADDLTHTGEQLGMVIGPFDFTSHFTSYFTGSTSKTCDIQTYFSQSTGTTLGMVNVNSLVTMTYEYNDDTAVNPTQIKTVYIPLESDTGSLSTATNGNFGTNQIPVISGSSGICPESNMVIRDYAIMIVGNNGITSSADVPLSCSIDNGSAFGFALSEGALASPYFERLIYKPTTPDTGSTHNFQMWTNTTRRFEHITVTLQLTYEFNAASSSQILNSVIMPINVDEQTMISTTARGISRTRYKFFIPESNITMKQSALQFIYNHSSNIDLGVFLKLGNQTAFRRYDQWANNTSADFRMQQRIDSGSVVGAALNLIRGENELIIDYYVGTTVRTVAGVTAYLNLNYISDKSTLGIGAHNHTFQEVFLQFDGLGSSIYLTTKTSVQIPESNYYFNSAGMCLHTAGAPGSSGNGLTINCLSNEMKGGGAYTAWENYTINSGERGVRSYYFDICPTLKRYPQSPLGLDMEIARNYTSISNATNARGIWSVMTYHSITWTTTLNITNSSGGTVIVKVYRVDNDNLVLVTGRVGNGSVTLVGYDNTVDYYAMAYESDTKLGRSNNFNFGD